jgi:hypothetical protein
MRFEGKTDLERESKAIKKFLSIFNGSAEKLGPHDVDYKILDENKKPICYAEVKGRIRDMKDAYPLPIAARKLVKLADKELEGVIIWACNDGIIYGQPSKLKGAVRYGGRTPRPGAANDQEIMIYYDKQDNLKWKTDQTTKNS